MSLTQDLTQSNQRVIGGNVDPSRLDRAIEKDHDVVDVKCGACGGTQQASGRALGYTCDTCGETWRVLKCRECRKASLVLEGVTACPRCGHDHHRAERAIDAPVATWLTEPVPLSIWLGNVKYLGGHADCADPVGTAGLLLDRRGIHVRAFAELFSIEWTSVRGIDIEGPQDISERLTTTRLLSLGASTWALQVSYLTVRTTSGDAIFEVDGLNPPELHARLSRVNQGLKQSERLHAPVTIERPATPTRQLSDWVEPPSWVEPDPVVKPISVFEPPVTVEPAPVVASSTPPPTAPTMTTTAPSPSPSPSPATTASPAPLAIDVQGTETPIEVLVIDALWKLAHLHEVGLIDDGQLHTLRGRLLTRIPELDEINLADHEDGPLLHV